MELVWSCTAHDPLYNLERQRQENETETSGFFEKSVLSDDVFLGQTNEEVCP